MKKSAIKRENREIPVSELTQYGNNPRTHSRAQVNQICDMINEVGFTNPLLVDEKNIIIAGHGRLQAAKKLKMKSVPCVVLSGLTETQKKALVIADNQLALNAGWDDELLSQEILSLKGDDFNTALLGFGNEEMDRLLAIEPKVGLTDEDEVPETPAEPVSKVGDIWALSEHRVMCGDSTGVLFMNALMNGDNADLLITDPPYNVAYTGKTKEALKIQNDSMEDSAFIDFLVMAFKCADKSSKPGGAFYIWHADSEGYNFRSAVKNVDWMMKQCLIWLKNTIVMGRQDYHWKHEPCLYGWKPGAPHYWGGDRKQSTILEFDRPTKSTDHPTMKPVSLFEYQIKNSSMPGGIVLDMFGGSGTTLMACEKLGRKARLMELDPKYCDVIIKRWEDYTGKKAKLEKHTGTNAGRAA